MSDFTNFFSTQSISNPNEDKIAVYYTILDLIVEALSKVPNSDNFEILGCYSLNKQLHSSQIVRFTKDIDLSVSVKDTWEYIVDNLVSILNSMQDSYVFRIIKRRGYTKNPNSDSVVFEVINVKTQQSFKDVKIDMNIKCLHPEFSITIDGLHYTDLYTMLSNKLYVVATPKIYRRVKDFYDIYLILKAFKEDRIILEAQVLFSRFSQLYKIESDYLIECLKEDFYDKLKHAYKSNDIFDNKESFDEVFDYSIKFIHEFYFRII